jgi:hypothetical protein
MSFNLAAVKVLGDALGDVSAESKPVARKPAPEPINSDITRDHWLEMPGCFHRDTCLPVKPSKDNKSRVDYHQCLSFSYDQYHDECCFMHSIGARSGSKHPEGCSQKFWPEDTHYYENRQNYAQE